MSEKRGSDTFGISFKLDKKIIIYKINEKPLKAVNKIDYLKFLESNIKNEINDTLQLIGQTRLVTNGSKFSYSNNQPLQSENIVGVHNGIFTNLQSYSENKTENLESYNIKSDSLKFFEQVSKLANDKNFFNLYENYLASIIGNYSLAFQIRNENKIIISSNCGSLYYYFDGTFFSFASEKKILFDFLKKSKII